VLKTQQMHWEVEQKFRVSDPQAIRASLDQLDVHWHEPLLQVDHYFNHPTRDFGRTDEALRIRQVGEQNFITYKGPKIDATTKTRRELELPLPGGAKVSGQFSELLKALGFVSVATVSKTRQPGSLSWSGHEVEVALDNVHELGSFLELELLAADNGLDAAKAALAALSERLNLGASERRSYLELILTKKS
jgi:adenylate cyclase, class 2